MKSTVSSPGKRAAGSRLVSTTIGSSSASRIRRRATTGVPGAISSASATDVVGRLDGQPEDAGPGRPAAALDLPAERVEPADRVLEAGAATYVPRPRRTSSAPSAMSPPSAWRTVARLTP